MAVKRHKCPTKKASSQQRVATQNSRKQPTALKGKKHTTFNIYTRKKICFNEKNIKNTCQDILAWAFSTKRMHLEGFWIEELCISIEASRYLRAKFKILVEYCEVAKAVLGMRREQLCIDGEISDRRVEKTEWNYFRSIRELKRAEKEFDAELVYNNAVKIAKVRAELMAKADTDEKKAAITWVLQELGSKGGEKNG